MSISEEHKVRERGLGLELSVKYITWRVAALNKWEVRPAMAPEEAYKARKSSRPRFL